MRPRSSHEIRRKDQTGADHGNDQFRRNHTLIAGTTANPDWKTCSRRPGRSPANTASLFEITNTSGGQFNGFRFQLTGAGFTYSGTTPTGGTIDGITVLAPDGVTRIIEVTAIGGPEAEQDLVDFFTTLIDPTKARSGSRRAPGQRRCRQWLGDRGSRDRFRI